VTLDTAAHVHGVRMSVITLARKISVRMAVDTSRVPEHWNERGEQGSISCRGRGRSSG
jgi:hypothetical protein